MILSREILLQGKTNFNFIYLPQCSEISGIPNDVTEKYRSLDVKRVSALVNFCALKTNLRG